MTWTSILKRLIIDVFVFIFNRYVALLACKGAACAVTDGGLVKWFSKYTKNPPYNDWKNTNTSYREHPNTYITLNL